MKVVAGDFSTKIPSWALADRFVFGDKSKGEPVLYAHIERAEVQEETKKGLLVAIHFLDGRRLLAQLTEDEYLQVRGAIFETNSDVEARRVEAVDHADRFQAQQRKKMAQDSRNRKIALAVVVGLVVYAMFKPDDATDNSTNSVASSAPDGNGQKPSVLATPAEKPRTTPTPIKGVIQDGAVTPITKDQYPKTYKQWGKKGIERVNSLLPQAAELIVESGTCDKLEVIDLSDRSKAPNSIVFFADCANGKRFYVSEADIKTKSAVVSKNDKTARYSDGSMIEMCTNAVKSSLQHPSTFNASFGGTTVYRAPTGNVVVNIDFEAKNGLGNELPHRGRCVFDDRGMAPPEISPR